MNAQQITFRIFSEELTVDFANGMYTSPCNGQQHSTLAAAVRAECEEFISAGGDDASEFEKEIQAAIKSAK
jgi:hypothetical protein